MDTLPREILNLVLDELNPSTLYTLLSSVSIKDKINEHNYYRGRMAFIDNDIFNQNNEYIHPKLLFERFKISYKLLIDCPAKFLTDKLCRKMIYKDNYYGDFKVRDLMEFKYKSKYLLKNIIEYDYSIFKIPKYTEYFMTPELISIIVGYVDNIKHIPHKYFTKETCLAILNKYPFLSKHFPMETIPKEISEIIKKNGYHMIGISDDELTEEFLSLALNDMGIKISDINEETAYKLIKINGNLIKIIPKDVISEDLYMKAVNNKCYLKYIDAELLSEDKFIKCLEYMYKNHINRIKPLPEKFITKKVMEFIYNYFGSFNMVREYIDVNLFMKFKNDGDFPNDDLFKYLKYIQSEDVNNVIEDFIIDNFDKIYFSKIPNKFKTTKVCIKAVQYDAYNLCHVPNDRMPPEVYYEAMKENGDHDIFNAVPADYKTKEYCQKFLDINPLCIKYTPLEYRTQEACIKAVEINGDYIEYVPHKYRTIKMYHSYYKSVNRIDNFHKFCLENEIKF